MKIIDGKKIAEKIKSEIAKEVAAMIDKDERGPHLVAILVGDDAASHTYVASKEKACASVGMTSSIYRHPSSISEKELLEIVDFLNNDDEVDGFIVQLPLPAHIDENKIIQRIDPKKDVDGFHPINIGKMVLGLPTFISATPQGIMMLLEQSKIETAGKHVVVVGRSNIVGTPVSVLLSRKAKNANATVTLCHSKTENLKEICKSADILIAAIGVCEFIKADMVKEGAVVIDVGMHRVASTKTQSGFKLIGDVAFDEVAEKCSYITPVPGGVGPMTIVSLLQNTLKAYKKEVR
ncbi:MAG: bifunctional methylenetetrahydrofolate dehydrogenase/methenyltetrahydrofolate cyclohydrolase FolD [Bacteroidetes bacterium]|nr:bifunctional methylenetetrahydrofolate dehydrogenase/methenyltetrahydrofolate cyclohydrolase FolD [Bacteroidota bacterium]